MFPSTACMVTVRHEMLTCTASFEGPFSASTHSLHGVVTSRAAWLGIWWGTATHYVKGGSSECHDMHGAPPWCVDSGKPGSAEEIPLEAGRRRILVGRPKPKPRHRRKRPCRHRGDPRWRPMGGGDHRRQPRPVDAGRVPPLIGGQKPRWDGHARAVPARPLAELGGLPCPYGAWLVFGDPARKISELSISGCSRL